MSYRALTIVAFAIAVALTLAGFEEVWLRKWVPPQKTAVWFPLLVTFRLPEEFSRFFVCLVQFPLFATAFSLGIRRWKVLPTLCGVLLCYGLSVGVAFMLIKAK